MIEKQIQAFNVKAMAQSEAKIKKAFMGLSTDIIMDTPVLSGRLRNNWFPSVNEGTDKTTNYTGEKGVAATNRVSAIKFKLGDTLYLTNNLPYAKVVEFGEYPSPSKTGKTVGGFSAKSPKGMVRVNILKWSKYFV